MTEFYNPYHFIPVKAGGSLEDLATDEFDNENTGHITHDRYVASRGEGENESPVYSGRLICRLCTESATVLGADQKERHGRERVVKPYTLDKQAAVPESSLRGLVSALAEAASNSAMRVLEDTALSIRTDMGHALHRIGMLESDDSGRMKLRPLVIPAYSRSEPYLCDIDSKMFPRPYLEKYAPLRVYIDGYRKINSSPPHVAVQNDSFLSRLKPDSYGHSRKEFWYMELTPSSVAADGKITCAQRPASRRQEWIVGQLGRGTPISSELYERDEGLKNKDRLTRGILRVLGIEGREDSMPTSKKHEIFIPYPEEIEAVPLIDAEDALTHFHALVDNCADRDDTFPYELKGMKKKVVGAGKNKKRLLRLKSGDLVFFRPEEKQNGEVVVAELAVSSIWRQGKGNCFAYFSDLDPGLLPMNPERESISIAEQLFGFVETGTEKARALAGRVRFSSGRLAEDIGENAFLPAVPLKILSTPKPPAPALYFTNKEGRAAGKISKQQLGRDKHSPQGRKYYLHCQPDPVPDTDNEDKPPWETRNTEHRDQKAEVRPLKSGLDFYFHVDFDNLSETELGLLLYALRPSAEFRHKLGMGKPIGLGRVEVTPLAFFQVDRQERYRTVDLFSGRRYSKGWLSDQIVENGKEALQRLYSREWDEAGDLQSDRLLAPEWAQTLRQHVADAIEEKFPAISRAIGLLGDPANIEHPVHYPQLHNKHNMEENLYKWFTENERTEGRQYLRPIEADTEALPTLDRNPAGSRSPAGGSSQTSSATGGTKDQQSQKQSATEKGANRATFIKQMDPATLAERTRR